MTAPTPEQNDGSYFDSLVPRVTRADLEREMAKVVIPPKTPEQMRELATALDAGVFRNEGLWPDEAQDVENSIVALRTAADQLEAVQALHFSFTRTGERLPECASCGSLWPCDTHELLTTDTAPQSHD